MTADPDPPSHDRSDPEERLGRLCDELNAALAAGESIDAAVWARRTELPEADVRRAAAALSAMRDALGDEPGTAARSPLPPPHLPADYELLGELGRGGMGVVYRARQRSLDRELAVKVLRPGELWFADAVVRFEREAKSLARLRHRHIVSVHEVGRTDGFVYFTMDYIAGETLHKRLEHGPLTTSEAVRLLSQVASAIAYAHQKGVVHRDLKPANILIDHAGDAFVVDFGLARDLAAGAGSATISGQLLGTPGYMSPEQALGDRARIGEASDVYALGAVLYECLTGAPPFAGLPLAQLMHAVIEREPLPARKRNARVPPDLEVICDKALQKRPEDRYATVQALAEDLERFTIGREILARRRSGLVRTVRLLRRNHRAVLSGVAVVLALLVFGWWFVLPTVLRRQAVALAERLHADGSATGAVTAYREAFAGVDAASLPAAERLGYVRAMVDEAGRLYLRGGDADAVPAAAMVGEAARVLGEVPDFPFGSPVSEAEAMQHRDLLFEQLRIRALHGVRDHDTGMAAQVLQTLLVTGRRGVGVDANRVLALWLRSPAIEPVTRDLLDALLEVLPAMHHLPSRVQEHLRFLTMISWPLETDADFELERMDRLVAMVGDRKLPLPTRRAAAAVFHRLDWLPFVIDEETVATDHGSYSASTIGEQDLDWVVASYREVRDLDRLAGCRRRMQLVGQRLLDAAAASGRGRDLRSWLRRHGGPSQEAALADWLREQAHGDPRQWLLDQLRWTIAVDAVRPRDVLARMRRGDGDFHQLVALLELIVPPDTRVPLVSIADGAAGLVRWEAALGECPDLRRRLHVAMFLMVDGEPVPRLAWQHRAVLGPDAPLDWQDGALAGWPLGNAYIGGRMAAHWLRQNAALRVVGNANLHWDGKQLSLQCTTSITGGAFAVGRIGQLVFDHEVPEGMVGCCGGAFVEDRVGATSVTWFTLATLRPLDEPDEAWTAERWRAESGGSIERLATSPPEFYIRRLKHMVLATLWPMPEKRAQLRALHDKVNGGAPSSRDYLYDLRRAALLLAGDAEALAFPVLPEARSKYQVPVAPDFWLRLLLTTNDPALRDAACAQIRPGGLDGGRLRTLDSARRGGFVVPEALAARLSTARSARTLWWSVHALPVVLATANVVVVLVLLRGLFRRPVRRLPCVVLMLLGWALTNWSLVIGTTECNPVWLGHAVHGIGCAALCWGRPGALPLLTALWWAGATLAHCTDSLSQPLLVWSIAALLLLGQLMPGLSPRTPARRRESLV
jgi:predicted Ser/Thr protein kinase